MRLCMCVHYTEGLGTRLCISTLEDNMDTLVEPSLIMLPFPSSPQGTDPAADLYKFAEEMKFHKKLSAISLGQGQVRTRNKHLKSSSLRDWAGQVMPHPYTSHVHL